MSSTAATGSAFALDPATDIRNQHGAPGWFELVSPDPAAAAEVLSDLLGWSVSPLDAAETGGEYLVAEVAGHGIGGIRRAMPGEPEGPTWITYITVDDVDAIAATAGSRGHAVAVPPTDLGQAGRFTVVGTEHAGVLYAFQYHRPFA